MHENQRSITAGTWLWKPLKTLPTTPTRVETESRQLETPAGSSSAASHLKHNFIRVQLLELGFGKEPKLERGFGHMTRRTAPGTWLLTQFGKILEPQTQLQELEDPKPHRSLSHNDVRNQGKNVKLNLTPTRVWDMNGRGELAAAGHVVETTRKSRDLRPELTEHNSWNMAVESSGNVTHEMQSVETESHKLETESS